MTDKEIKKLKRADLLEILYYLQKEIEELTKENESLKKIMENQQLSLSENELKRITVNDELINKIVNEVNFRNGLSERKLKNE